MKNSWFLFTGSGSCAKAEIGDTNFRRIIVRPLASMPTIDRDPNRYLTFGDAVAPTLQPATQTQLRQLAASPDPEVQKLAQQIQQAPVSDAETLALIQSDDPKLFPLARSALGIGKVLGLDVPALLREAITIAGQHPNNREVDIVRDLLSWLVATRPGSFVADLAAEAIDDLKNP